MNEGLCGSCVNSIFCPVWGEVKCVAKFKRILGIVEVNQCEDFKARPKKDFKERSCRCPDCLESGYTEEEIEV